MLVAVTRPLASGWRSASLAFDQAANLHRHLICLTGRNAREVPSAVC